MQGIIERLSKYFNEGEYQGNYVHPHALCEIALAMAEIIQEQAKTIETHGVLIDRLEKQVWQVNNTTSCLANGITPD